MDETEVEHIKNFRGSSAVVQMVKMFQLEDSKNIGINPTDLGSSCSNTDAKIELRYFRQIVVRHTTRNSLSSYLSLSDI